MHSLLSIIFLVGNLLAIGLITFTLPTIGEGGLLLGIMALWVSANIAVIAALMATAPKPKQQSDLSGTRT